MSSAEHAMRRLAIRIAALGFGLFIVAAVVIANLGYGGICWPFLDRIPYGDKLGHVGLFGILGFLCNLALPRFRIRRLPRPISAVTLVLLVLISLEEVSQAFIPSRNCDLHDWLADVAGLAIGQIAASVFSHLVLKKEMASIKSQHS